MSSAGPDGAACLPRKQYYLRCQASQRQVWTWPAVLANASLAASAAISASGYSSAYVTVISCDWIQVGTFKVDTELSSLFRESCLPPGSSLASWVPFPRHQILLISQALLGSVASHYQLPSWRLISTTKPCWSLPFPSSNAVTSRLSPVPCDPPSGTLLMFPFKTRVFITTVSRCHLPTPFPDQTSFPTSTVHSTSPAGYIFGQNLFNNKLIDQARWQKPIMTILDCLMHMELEFKKPNWAAEWYPVSKQQIIKQITTKLQPFQSDGWKSASPLRNNYLNCH